MTAEEIFAKINSHMIEGIMYHDQMANYFDFLSLHGYKRLHEYHAIEEAAARRSLNRYFINHFDMLIPEIAVTDPKAIPDSWHRVNRTDVDISTKRRAVRDGFTRWREWETETKKLYEQSYKDLCDIGEIAAACKVKELACDVDMELKCADRMYIMLYSVDYDINTIYLCQDGLHEEYANKTKEIGVDIC